MEVISDSELRYFWLSCDHTIFASVLWILRLNVTEGARY